MEYQSVTTESIIAPSDCIFYIFKINFLLFYNASAI